jgi:hypothetical protein
VDTEPTGRADTPADAALLRRGVMRMLRDMGYAGLAEVALASGRRADVLGIHRNGSVVIVEIKTTVADFRADAKWPDYLDWCDRFFFAVPHDFPVGLLPEDHGVILADPYGADVVRDTERRPLAAARRRALTLRVARGAAERLHRLADPDIGAASA